MHGCLQLPITFLGFKLHVAQRLMPIMFAMGITPCANDFSRVLQRQRPIAAWLISNVFHLSSALVPRRHNHLLTPGTHLVAHHIGRIRRPLDTLGNHQITQLLVLCFQRGEASGISLSERQTVHATLTPVTV